MIDVTTAAAPSPLAEAEPISLEELFARMDEHIAKRTLSSTQAGRTLDEVVSVLRRQAENWAKAEAEGAKRAPSAKSGGSAAKERALRQSLDDIGL